MSKKPDAIELLKERFRREARDNKEKTIGRIVYTQVQIYGDVSYEVICKELLKMMTDSPSERGEISPELDVQLHDATEAFLFLRELHEPHDS